MAMAIADPLSHPPENWCRVSFQLSSGEGIPTCPTGIAGPLIGPAPTYLLMGLDRLDHLGIDGEGSG